MDRVLALITARSGSKSISEKNLQKIGDRSLLAWSASCISKCSVFYNSIISTDSPDYADEVKPYNIEVPFLRPRELAQDKSTDAEVFAHLISWLQVNSELPEWIAHFRPTTPFRNPKFIDAQVLNFLADSDRGPWTAARSVHQMTESAYKFFELQDELQLVSIFKRESSLDKSNFPKESFPKTYIPNGYIDLIRTSHFLKENKLHGNKVKAIITDPTIEIDSYHDLLEANIHNSANAQLMKLVF